MKLKNKLEYNYFVDLRKKEIDEFERAALISDYMERNRVTYRSFAAKFGFKHSTVEDWMLWHRITREECKKLKEKGMSHTDIYRLLRDNRPMKKEQLLRSEKIDTDLQSIIKKMKSHTTNFQYSHRTEDLLLQLRDMINRMLMKIDNGKQ